MKSEINELNSIADLDDVLSGSSEQPVFLFKHSTACPISSHVLEDVLDIETRVNLIVVQRARIVSNEIADRFGVRHESPQAIVIKKGKVTYHASHYDVSADEIVGHLVKEG